MNFLQVGRLEIQSVPFHIATKKKTQSRQPLMGKFYTETPLALADAIQIVQDYLETGVTILSHKPTQLSNLLNLLNTVTTRKNIFDVVLVATLKDHGISGLYTVNTKDFKDFTTFLDVKKPLE